MLPLKTAALKVAAPGRALALTVAMLISVVHAAANTHYSGRGVASAAAHAEKFVTPELAAQRLYNAWRKGSRRAALQVATKGAVNTLFGNHWKSWGPMTFKGCERMDGGSIVCRYIGRGSGVLEIEVEGGVSVGGYNVVSVSLFSAND